MLFYAMLCWGGCSLCCAVCCAVQLYLAEKESEGEVSKGLWQRLVGLMACREPHPEHWAPLVDSQYLPITDEVNVIRKQMYKARMYHDQQEVCYVWGGHEGARVFAGQPYDHHDL